MTCPLSFLRTVRKRKSMTESGILVRERNGKSMKDYSMQMTAKEKAGEKDQPYNFRQNSFIQKLLRDCGEHGYYPNPDATDKEIEDIVMQYQSQDKTLRQNAVMEMIMVLFYYILGTLFGRYNNYMAKHADDMVQNAFFAVCDGMRKYDPGRGRPSTWFKRFICAELRKYTTEYVSGMTQHYYGAKKKIMTSTENAPERWTIEDIAKMTGLPEKTVRTVLEMMDRKIVSLDEAEGVDSRLTGPEECYILKAENERIHGILYGDNSFLSEQEKSCIRLRYGFCGKRRSYNDIAKILHVTPCRIKKTVKEANGKMYRALKGYYAFQS